MAVGILPEAAVRYFGKALHIDVDPSRLTRRISDYVGGDTAPRWLGRAFLDAAQWDDALAPVDRSPIHIEMYELVASGGDFRATKIYRHYVRGLKRRKRMRNGARLRTVEDVEAYLQYCLALIESAHTHGVMRRRDAGAFHRLRLQHRNTRPAGLDLAERDIGVAITAEGELVRHLGGKHRTAVAQALNLPSLPVEVRLVHVDWLTRQMRVTGLPAHKALPHGIVALRERFRPAQSRQAPYLARPHGTESQARSCR